MSMQTLPLHCLALSTLNVRQTERDADIATLAEDIAASGLKQNLVVIPAHFSTVDLPEGSNYGDKFEVVAGGRRLQALQLLAEDGRLEHDWPVPVMVEPRESARQTSLSENLHRVAMNPADEFEAFAAIVDQAEKKGEGDPIATCAKRFGVTRTHVEGRLRLAALAPEVLDALRTGKIGVESAKAYAITSDHEHQLKVFAAQEKAKWQPHHAPTVRDAMRGRTLPLDSKLVRFVGLDDYRAAGGRVEAEMFMGDAGQERIIDVTLLEKLAKEYGATLAGGQAKKDGFKDGLLSFGGYDHSPNWPKAPDGFEKVTGWRPQLEATKKAQRKPCVAVYRIDGAGEGLEYLGHFGPVKEAPAGGDALPAPQEVDWAERRRQRIAGFRAGQLIARQLIESGQALDFILPQDEWVCAVETDDASDDHVLIAVQIRTTVAELEARREEALRLVDEEAAAEAARRAAAAEAAIEAEDAHTEEGAPTE
jgi:ParB family chromosome partitioning protein